jgi:transposase
MTANLRKQAIALYREGLTIRQTADRLGLGASYSSVRLVLREAGILRARGGVVPVDEDAVANHYRLSRSSSQTALAFNLTPSRVLRIVRDGGVPIVRRGGKRRYKYDPSFFDTYTPASCYWAGFLAADGCLVKSQGAHRTQVLLQKEDQGHLRSFAKCAGSTHPVKIVKVGGHEEAQLVVSSKEWWDALHAHFNLEKCKSLTLRPPPRRLSKSMSWHFMRGYFDGDGSVHDRRDSNGRASQMSVVSGSRRFMNWVKRLWNCDAKVERRIAESGNPIFKLTVSGKTMRRIVKRLYRESLPKTRLERKFHRLLSILSPSALRTRTGRKRTLSDFEEARLCATYASGRSISGLARDYGLATSTISRTLKRCGLKARPARGEGRPRRLDADSERAAVADYASGMTVREIAETRSVSTYVIQRTLKRHGVKLSRSRRSPRTFKLLLQEQEDELVQRYQEGATHGELGHTFSVSAASVYRLLKKRGVIGDRAAKLTRTKRDKLRTDLIELLRSLKDKHEVSMLQLVELATSVALEDRTDRHSA